MFQSIEGGAAAAKGFTCSGIHCGIRKNKSKKDLALIVSEKPCAAAAVYTQNLVKGAPITVTRAHLEDGRAQAVIVNSGYANTCNANGIEIAEGMCALVEAHTGIKAADVVVASTGIIGQPLSLEPIAKGMPALIAGLTSDGRDAAEAIMTTDTVKKEAAVSFVIDGKECRVGGMAKGSGMINPNMATLLCFITTDVNIPAALLREAVGEAVQDSFNMLSIDGDTSTNDMLSVLANGMSGIAPLKKGGAGYAAFLAALKDVCRSLCRMMAGDGEGASKLIECVVTGAATVADARKAAKSVVMSTLFKCAMFGADANWGRALCAIGYSGADVDITNVDIAFASKNGHIAVCGGGASLAFDETAAKNILSADEIEVRITFYEGESAARAWGCDMTYDYVKINGDYRS
ncbi:MAG: bifunctional glutamate N-acetyltransferase/amino-acid acetyltransferase ArgJ [Clostridiales bacterium]|jgi:glutamate N-acetyltransferase/amino-acid N-acetyltransferase|nr:bifunctional glutamate N-acetyltransferase/amino-acid acetyltransferase ArgJ [Clostridiales bacterium]